MTVRAMHTEDVETVARLEAEIFTQPWSSQAFLESLNLGNTVFLVTEEDRKITGYAGMYTALDEGEITNVAVALAERGRGAGRMLIEEMKKEAKRRNLARIVLEVRVSNYTAIRLYERCGFASRGIRRDFYEKPRENAWVMVYGQ